MARRSTPQDALFMQQAIALAEKGKGRTSPNPPVGAVIVKQGRVVGKGWHRKAGTDHAEVAAIKDAGSAARGAVIYVTLEPCSTTGRTGACTEALIEAGISRVICGSVDPNPDHEGRGLRILRRRGLSVTKGVLSDETDELIAPFAKWVTSRMPYITLKMAMSIDGRCTDRAGKSKWITGPESRASVKISRGKVDAVMVGAGTARKDNPSLLPVSAGSYRPNRVVLTDSGNLAPNSNLLADEWAKNTIVVTGSSCSQKKEAALTIQGAKLIRVRSTTQGLVLKSAMRKLAEQDILHIYCEGGPTLAAALIRERLVDRMQVYSAPFILGDDGCTPVLFGQSWTLKSAPRMSLLRTSRIGEDLFAEYSIEKV